jgi:hypothetical protein
MTQKPRRWRVLEFQKMPRVTPGYPESERYSSRVANKIVDDEDRGEGLSRGNLIAHVYNHTGDVQANARLIAAAPDLLAALQGMLHGLRVTPTEADYHAEREEACAAARAAIAKATGD